MKQGFGVLIIAMLGLMALNGCSNSDKSSETAANNRRLVYEEKNANQRFDNTDMVRQVFDMNHDGQIDLWKYYSYKKTIDVEGKGELIISRKELDLNFDGRIDRIMFYNQKENLIKEEIDTNFDGNIDRIHYYDNGLIVKTEFYELKCNSIQIDGESNPETNPNLIRFYRQGVLTREENDAACDGKHETVTLFNAEGEIVQVGLDEDGDGVIENWIRY
ncbi:MAG: hypothetical protein IJM59_01830 [Proteobacteria bacterium]|nr:hypothetical protein [Pseudomonadota bacterium]